MSTLANHVTERELQAAVLSLLTHHGYLAYHTYDSRRSEPGFPDICAVNPDRVNSILFLELKREKGKLRQAQRDWLTALRAAGQQAYVIRPSDMDRLERLIAGDASPCAA